MDDDILERLSKNFNNDDRFTLKTKPIKATVTEFARQVKETFNQPDTYKIDVPEFGGEYTGNEAKIIKVAMLYFYFLKHNGATNIGNRRDFFRFMFGMGAANMVQASYPLIFKGMMNETIRENPEEFKKAIDQLIKDANEDG